MKDPVAGENACAIIITVMRKPLPPFPDQVYSCSPSKGTDLVVSTAKCAVKMKCPTNLALQPSDDATAYDDKNGGAERLVSRTASQ
ncbi:SAG-related sequence [Besnoitia besnoiti]|uniref:SAG-related sequence n=1 Tax=Besnoitia besnoiti TaxID=94643 RepID=A0A2A9MNC2_BESBE|nr:SAG-related sequence [Besnoitia besnoiti]PFH37373.1 SAG-related sequence [Besnoitia besnoiti]